MVPPADVLSAWIRSASQRRLAQVVVRVSYLRHGCGGWGLLIMLGGVLVTTVLGGAAEEVRRFDNNRDGKTDQWEFYRDGTLLRVEVDRNRDGRADEITFYERGKPVHAEFDTNGDGKINQREFYDTQGVVDRVQVDRDGDSLIEPRLFYGPGKKPLRAEVDEVMSQIC